MRNNTPFFKVRVMEERAKIRSPVVGGYPALKKSMSTTPLVYNQPDTSESSLRVTARHRSSSSTEDPEGTPSWLGPLHGGPLYAGHVRDSAELKQ
jgi:hypothetical protein